MLIEHLQLAFLAPDTTRKGPIALKSPSKINFELSGIQVLGHCVPIYLDSAPLWTCSSKAAEYQLSLSLADEVALNEVEEEVVPHFVLLVVQIEEVSNRCIVNPFYLIH